MTNSPQFAPQVNSVVESITKELRRLTDTLDRPSFEAVQSQVLAVVNESARRLFERMLQERADNHPEFVRIDGVVYRRHLEGRVQYHDLCGALQVSRATYRPIDRRNGETVVPLELEAGLILRTTPVLAFAVMQGHANSPPRQVEKDMRAAHRCPPSRATLDRLGRNLGSEFKKAIPRIEPVVRSEESLLDDAYALSLGLDRTSVPMAEGEGKDVKVHYRMAYVGTVSIRDRDGNNLQARRYAAAAHEGPRDIIKRMMADVRWALSQAPSLHVVLVQDGADEMWNLMRPALKSEPLVTKWREVIDWYHVAERLARIAELMESDPQRRQRRLKRWKAGLLRNDRAIYRITREIHVHWEQQGRPLGGLVKHFPYLLLSRQMHYASLRAHGLPIGSGVTEGACKSLVACRAKRSGQRWRPKGIDALFAIRATEQSDRLGPSWRRFAAQFTAQVCAA